MMRKTDQDLHQKDDGADTDERKPVVLSEIKLKSQNQIKAGGEEQVLMEEKKPFLIFVS